MLITIDGMDGCGKTTVCGALAERIKKVYKVETEVVKLPSVEIQTFRHYKHEVEYYLEDILDTFEKVICPLRTKGVTVICDRWLSSTYLYQSFNKDYKDYTSVDECFQFIDATLKKMFLKKPKPAPDLCVYLSNANLSAYKKVCELKEEEPQCELFKHVNSLTKRVIRHDLGVNHLRANSMPFEGSNALWYDMVVNNIIEVTKGIGGINDGDV